MPNPAFVDEVDELHKYEQAFVLSTDRWAAFPNSPKLKWRSVRFQRNSKAKVPTDRGVYAFVVRPMVSGFPIVGYLLYIGETGNDGKSNLRKRFLQYFGEQKKRKRPTTYYFLNKWSEHLYFHFAPIPDTTISTEDVENDLCDALIPPFSTNDFSAAVRPKVRALRST